MFKRRTGGVGVGAFALGAALVCGGCSADAQDSSGSAVASSGLTQEEAEVGRYLEFNGVTEYEFRREEGWVVIEKDGLASFEDMLAMSRSFDYSQEPVEKGYWWAAKAAGAYQGRVTRAIRLAFAANVPQAWRTAFNNAASEWNAAQCITYTDNFIIHKRVRS